MTQLPYYRAHVLVLLPQLRTLDGKAVTEEEVARAHGAVFQEASTLAVMVSNACLVHKLSRTAQARRPAARRAAGAAAVGRLCRGCHLPARMLRHTLNLAHASKPSYTSF